MINSRTWLSLVMAVSLSCGADRNAEDGGEPEGAAAKKAKDGEGTAKRTGKKGKAGKKKGRGGKGIKDPSLDAFAEQVQAMVLAADAGGLEALWLTGRDLEGCTLEKEPPGGLGGFVTQLQGEFHDKAPGELAASKGGQLVFTHRRAEKKPRFKAGTLGGEGCRAQRFGRINVIVTQAGAPGVVEHRFNAQRIDGQWKLYRYLPARPDCETEKGRGHLGCRKLLAGGGD